MTKENFRFTVRNAIIDFSNTLGEICTYYNMSKCKYKLDTKSVIYQIPIFSTSAGKRGLICITT